jgi:membrane associated rhomboid family serine protease
MSHPWSDMSHELPEKPAGVEYGWVDADGWHRATRESLEARCRAGEPPHAVWTPDAPRLQLPGEVPWLREALAGAAAGARAPRRTQLALVLVGLAALAAWWLGVGPAELRWVGAGALGLALLHEVAAHQRARQTARSIHPEEIAAARVETAHARWLRAQRVTYTNYLMAVVAVCGVAQVVAGRDRSVLLAGLVPEAVRVGETWRLFTAPLLHGDPLHFFMNAVALVAVARMLEVHAHRAYVPLVFLVSAVAGSVASLVLPPETLSIGASGGVLGLVGALVALGHLRARQLPPRFTRALWATVAATALLGLVGWTFIDNAAHVGGFLAGLACGALFFPHRATPSVSPGRAVVLLGDLSMGAIVAAGAWAVVRMVG